MCITVTMLYALAYLLSRRVQQLYGDFTALSCYTRALYGFIK